jgi:hypothetical protein
MTILASPETTYDTTELDRLDTWRSDYGAPDQATEAAAETVWNKMVPLLGNTACRAIP